MIRCKEHPNYRGIYRRRGKGCPMCEKIYYSKAAIVVRMKRRGHRPGARHA